MSEAGGPVAARRVFWWTLLGVVLLQSAWSMSISSFRGPDEFDHAYKTAAVARAQLGTDGAAQRGRGGIVTVPRGLVSAAERACESRSYTDHDNCHPIDEPAPGLARVATAAGAYNPAWYAVVGTATRWVPGADLGPAIRVVGALLSALLIAWAAATTASWSTTRWPLLALSVAATPTLVYSTVIVAPNGVHYAAAMLTWSSALGFARGRERAGHYLVPFTAGASILVSTHTTGPMWLAIAGVAVLLLRPSHWWLDLIRPAAGRWALAAAVAVTATLASMAWARSAGANALGAADPSLPPFHAGLLVRSEILWPFQTVGAFPMRNDQAPWLAYIIWFTIFLTLCGLGLKRATGRARLAALVVVLGVVTIPAVLTAISFASNGLAWQGRYALPLSIGMPLLAGWCLDRNPVRMSARLPLLVGIAFGVAQLVSVVHVATQEMREYPVDPLAGRFPGGIVLMSLLALSGPILSVAFSARAARSTARSEDRVPVSVP